jgi:uncharacterized protein (TIGR02147 family)
MANLFDFTDYKAFIAAKVEENAAHRGYRTQLAQAAQCQKSFFSQVTRSHVHLTPDHAMGLCEFWAFDHVESEYFLALVDHARSGSPRLRAMLAERMRRLRNSRKDITKRAAADEIRDLAAETLYHSSWYWNALHVIVTIPEYQTPQAIANRLGLEHGRVTECLQQLEKMGLVSNHHGRWSMTKKSIHLDRSSAMRETHHTQWRQRAMLDIQKRTDDSIHYNSVFTVSEADAKRLHDLITETIVRSREIIGPSPEEELYCLCTDFFKV